MRKRLSGVTLAVLLLAASPQLVDAQNPQTRDGFWVNLGLGYGSLGCNNCGGREGGLSGGLSLGGTLGDRWLLGAGTNGWTKTQDNVTVTVGTLTALVRFYPAITSGFFLHGGLGLGRAQASASGGGFAISASESGAGAMLGIGWDIRVGGNVSLTPFWNGFAMDAEEGDANVGQIGLGLTIH